MYIIQEELELNKHHATDQYSIWVNVSDDSKKETEIVYIFSDLFRRSHMETEEKMTEFVNNTKGALIEKITIQAKEYKNHSIFDYPRHRIFFQKDISKLNINSNIGTTWEANLDKNLPTMGFSTPESFLSYIKE